MKKIIMQKKNTLKIFLEQMKCEHSLKNRVLKENLVRLRI